MIVSRKILGDEFSNTWITIPLTIFWCVAAKKVNSLGANIAKYFSWKGFGFFIDLSSRVIVIVSIFNRIENEMSVLWGEI